MICTMSAASRTRSTSSSGIMRGADALSGELRDGHTGAPFVPRAESERLHACVLTQHLGHASAQRAGSLSVDDAKCLEVGTHGCVECLHHDVIDVADALTAQVDLAGNVLLRQIAEDGHRLALPWLLLERSAQGRLRQR